MSGKNRTASGTIRHAPTSETLMTTMQAPARKQAHQNAGATHTDDRQRERALSSHTHTPVQGGALRHTQKRCGGYPSPRKPALAGHMVVARRGPAWQLPPCAKPCVVAHSSRQVSGSLSDVPNPLKTATYLIFSVCGAPSFFSYFHTCPCSP